MQRAFLLIFFPFFSWVFPPVQAASNPAPAPAAAPIKVGYPSESLKKIIFKFDLGNFVISKASVNTISLTLTVDKPDSRCQPTVVKKDDLITVYAVNPKGQTVLCKLKGEVAIPGNLALSVQLNSGTLRVGGISEQIEVDIQSGSLEMEKIDGNVKVLVKKGSVNINQSLVTGKIKVEDGGLKVSFSGIPPSRYLELELGKGILEMQIPVGTEVRDLSDHNLKTKTKDAQKIPEVIFLIKTKLDSGELIIKRT